MKDTFLFHMSQLDSSYLILLFVAGGGLAVAILFYTGLLGWALGWLGYILRKTIRQGFLLWKRLFAWASWPLFLAIVVGLLTVGAAAAAYLPALTVVCALVPLIMGLTACLAYMFIGLERYEVERGHKAVHNPLKGQGLAIHLVRYGRQVGVPLLAVATVGMIGGFALLNQGLYETIGRDWYAVGEKPEEPAYVDFLAYALIHLLRMVDLLNVARTHNLVEITYVRQVAWPASALLASFQTFFAFVLLQQIFASIRQGYLLVETITDFWSPHESIHERARNALPQYGTRAIGPLLLSLRSVECLTKEQRDRLPPILAAIGPSAIPALMGYLHDDHEHMRALAVTALGHLHALDELPLLVPMLVELAHDPSELVRQNLVETLGLIGAASTDPDRTGHRRCRTLRLRVRWMRRWFGWKKGLVVPAPSPDAITPAVSTLRNALADNSAAVRTDAARSLGHLGLAAAEVAPDLIALLKDAVETVRCEAVESLGKVKGSEEAAVSALIELLQDTAPSVKTSAARALGALKKAAAPAVLGLVPLLQDQDESIRLAAADPRVRTAAVEAMGQWGEANEAALSSLMALLEDANDQVKVQVTQVLPKLAGATPAVIDGLCRRLLEDNSVLVQCSAAQALSKLGPAAAAGGPLLRAAQTMDVTVREKAMRAIAMIQPAEAGTAFASRLKDADGEIRRMASAGWMKAAAIPEEVIPALVEALRDPEVQVRANAAHALARLDALPTNAVPLLIACTADAHDGLRMNAALAPKLATGNAVTEAMEHLVEDASLRIRFIAASALLPHSPGHARTGAVLVEALGDPTVRLRQAALALVKSLGIDGGAFVEALRLRAGLEEEPELREALTQLVGELDAQIPPRPLAVAG